MGFKDKMKSMKQDLVKHTQESIDSGDDTPEYGSVFIRDKIPSGVGFWKPAVGKHLIDVIPFQTAGLHPGIEKGRWVYKCEFWAHMSVGSLYEIFICQVRAHKEPDPMCEYLRVKRLPTDEWKKIASKRRTAYLIWCHDTPEEKQKGIQIWEVAHWNFEKTIRTIAEHPRGGAPIPFSDVEDGKSIAFEIVKSGTFVNDQGKEQESRDFVGHRFVERDTPIPDEFGDKIFPLDGCIKWRPTWEEQEKAFPLSGEISLAPAKPSEDKQGDDTMPDDTPDETPKGPASVQPSESGEKKVINCPGMGTMGVDLQKLEYCNKCPVWDECADKADKLAKQSAEKKVEKEPDPPKEEPKKKIIRRRRPS